MKKRTTATPAPQGKTPEEQLKNMVRPLLEAYTRHHDDLRVDVARMGGSVAVTIQAHKDDHPRLVGSRGSHIWALQTVFAFVGWGTGTPVKITLLEPWTGEKLPLQDYRENPDWDPTPVVKLLRNILVPVFGQDVEVEATPGQAMTNLMVTTRKWDKAMTDHKLALALHQLFHAIGKAQGRIVHVEVLDNNGRARDPLAHVPAAPSGAVA